MLIPFLFFLFLLLVILGIKFKIFKILKKIPQKEKDKKEEESKKSEKKEEKTEKKKETEKVVVGGGKYSLKHILITAAVISIISNGIWYLNIPNTEWRLWWAEDSAGGSAGVFTVKIEKISPDYIKITFPGVAAKMVGQSKDGNFYEGTWNDPRPKKGGKGKWHFRFVSQSLAIGWTFSPDETKKRIIALQKK